jgi:hypothetical protein
MRQSVLLEEAREAVIKNLSINHDVDFQDDLDQRMLSTLYFRHIFKRVHTYKFNFLGMVTGKHRVGKSLTALSMSHILDPTFTDNLEDRVVYFPDDFMRALQNIKKKRIIGGAIIWDEAGVGMPAREWFDTANKSISYTLQVFGRYRPIVYFVTQDVSYIDSQARKLFHGFYEMNRMGNKCSIAKPFDVKYNKRNGKVYYIYPRLHMKHDDAYGCKVIIKKINVLRPFKELEQRYELHSKEFKDKIVEQMKERSEKYKAGDIDAKKMTQEEIVDKLYENRENRLYLSKRSKPENVIYDKDAIRIEFDVPDSLARHIKKLAEIKANDEEKITENIN